jgi:hypothetical protein
MSVELALRAGGTRKVSFYAVDGALCIAELDDRGDLVPRKLERIRTQRLRSSRGFRWHNQYRLPEEFVRPDISVRLHGNDDDAKRGFNRAENLRAIPPGDPDFKRLYARRSHAEALNRLIEDSLFLKKAHSVGHLRQEADLLGFALLTNSVTLARAGPVEQVRAA